MKQLPRAASAIQAREMRFSVRFLPAHASYSFVGWRREPLAGSESLGS